MLMDSCRLRENYFSEFKRDHTTRVVACNICPLLLAGAGNSLLDYESTSDFIRVPRGPGPDEKLPKPHNRSTTNNSCLY